MQPVKNILIVHSGENVDELMLKENLRVLFSPFVHVAMTDIATIKDFLQKDQPVFDVCICTPAVTKEQLPDFGYDIQILFAHK
jgi:hypothetical protein